MQQYRSTSTGEKTMTRRCLRIQERTPVNGIITTKSLCYWVECVDVMSCLIVHFPTLTCDEIPSPLPVCSFASSHIAPPPFLPISSPLHFSILCALRFDEFLFCSVHSQSCFLLSLSMPIHPVTCVHSYKFRLEEPRSGGSVCRRHTSQQLHSFIYEHLLIVTGSCCSRGD